ncbi:Lysophospholipase, alpha-beta hydrolase superfamily [Nannocystis exedens]|uniref:Lysophospholipase, alpha-beta hydrolase superfamily n=1 Tax=Nannocystis exedens TaxID=54 RepID=A0A1I1YB86_9BACT|nr:alpha/beta hydrolase [Nannocystis exedens]PCC71944.1 hydrolase [Nannocystis exedens]SFE16885.1 Lysophospholipase, alpha-beta hydrolase superfamily [Nannocystis exedens]
MKHETLGLPGDGATTHVHVWTPDDGQPVRGLVQVLHGLAEHAGRYEGLAAGLCDAGLAVVAHDHRGHGRTASGPDDLGFFGDGDGWSAVLADSARVRGHARERFGELPWALLGHSMGSVIALHDLAVSGARPAAVVLSGATGKVGALLRIGQGLIQVELRRIGVRGRSKLLNATAFGTYNRAFRPNRTQFDWLSGDAAQVDAYVRDPLCGFLPTTSLWRDLVGNQARLQTAEFLARLPRVPYAVVGGDLDPVGGKGRQVQALVAMMRKLGHQVDLRLWPGGRHEMFNETNRADVVAHTTRWLSERLAP